MIKIRGRNSRQLFIACMLSAIVILGVGFVSVYSIVKADEVYISSEMSAAKIPNDIVSLVLGIPAAIGCLIFAIRGKTLALICLPGVIYYFMYNYIVYFFEVALSWISVLYLLLIGVSAVVIVMIISMMDKEEIKSKLHNTVSAKLAGSILILLGIFVLGFQVSEIMSAGAGNYETGRALYFADIALGVPIMLVSGIYLLQKKAFGYIAGCSMLFSYVLQCLGLILLFVVASMVNKTALDVGGMAVISVMAILCIIPFASFVKGFAKKNI